MNLSRHKAKFFGALVACVFGTAMTAFAGWNNYGNNIWSYTTATGQPAIGWFDDNGVKYYADQYAIMQTGWLNDNNQLYYLDASGAMKTGWVFDNGAWYYMDPATGIAKTGWVQDGNDWYYMYQNGMMAAGGFLDLNGGSYYFDETGRMWHDRYAPDGRYVGADGAVTTAPTYDGSFSWNNNDEDNPITSNKLPSINDSKVPVGFTGFWTPVDTNYKHDEFVDGVIELTNEERRKHGRPELVVSDELMEAADIRAEEIAEQYSHTRPNGTKASTVLDDINFSSLVYAENIIGGPTSANDAVRRWMNSEGHKKNILHKRITKIGAGFYCASNGNTYWVQIFAE